MSKKQQTFDLDRLAKELAQEFNTKESLLGEHGFLKELYRRTIQAALDGELTDHLGYQKHEREPGIANTRNGYSKKTLKGTEGSFEIEVPRDRECSDEPQLIEKRQTRFDGLDDKIIALYSRGSSVRDIQLQLMDL